MRHLRPLISRRLMLAGLGAATFTTSRPVFASPTSANNRKLVLVILRGALDGLSALQPNDKALERYRLDLFSQNTLSVNSDFGLHASLKNVHEFYQSGDAALIPAIAGPWRERSHFLAQDLLESGSISNPLKEGWLNRALQVSPVPLSAVSIGSATPLIMRGKVATESWSPPILPEADEDTIARLLDLYKGDDVLGLALSSAVSFNPSDMMGGKGRRNSDLAHLTAAGRLLSAETGPDIAVVSLTGWDTHNNQAGLLSRKLEQLDTGLKALKDSLGPVWDETMVAVVTEFGRTVRQNGTRGTDHGTGSVAFVMGGRVKGRRMIGDWPGLSTRQLFENRDLYPANDLTSLFKGMMIDQFGFSVSDLNTKIFPDSAVRPFAIS